MEKSVTNDVTPDDEAPSDNAPQSRNVIYIALAALALVTLASLGAYVWSMLGAKSGSQERSVAYTTEAGDGTGAPDSPMTITVRLPWQENAPETIIGSVFLKLLDEAGNSARFGPNTPAGFQMGLSTQTGIWVYRGSLPSVAGSYKAQLEVQKLYGNDPPEIVELQQPQLRVIAESGPPLRSGFALSRDDDLWLLSTDAKRSAASLFFSGLEQRASYPSWSPDGSRIAFTYLPKLDAGQLPRTEIWTLNPDGSDLKRLATPGPDETLLHPTWSADGARVYFSVDRLSNDFLPQGTSLDPYRRVDWVEVATGKREQIFTGAQEPDSGNVGLVYIEDTPPVNPGDTAGQKLMLATSDGKKSVLIESGVLPKMQSPALSPDGKWVAFSAYDAVTPDEKAGFDLLEFLMIKPRTAEAHDAPWDAYLVPTSGGPETRLTTLAEDEPYPTWLDNQTVTLLGERGLYKQAIDGAGDPVGDPQTMRGGVRHGQIDWYAP